MPKTSPILARLTARDGTTFHPIRCRRAGGYWIGAKGSERKVPSYPAAVAALAMPVPRWRRPNRRGYWGIVRAR
jgi:hypothetical protein